VEDAAEFPVIQEGSGDWFYLTLTELATPSLEIVKVTATGASFTILRGADGTIARSWEASIVELRNNAEAATDLLATAISVNGKSGLTITLNPEDIGAVNLTAIGHASGVAALGPDGKVPTSQLPGAVLGALQYQGTWNATTNIPAIPTASIDNKGHYYKVSVPGSTIIDGLMGWSVGDWIVSAGINWDKIDNTDAINSVNGQTGNVVLGPTDVGAVPAVTVGVADGVAGLDPAAKVPTTQLPDAVLGALKYKGNWNASTNSPIIPPATSANQGWYYKVTTTGATSISGVNDWKVGDWIVSNGANWDKVDNNPVIPSDQMTVGNSLKLGNVDASSYALHSDLTWNSIAAKPATYEPPIATSFVLGGVKQGTNVTIAADGTLSIANHDYNTLLNVPVTFPPPVASATVLGGVKIGANVAIDGAGKISVPTFDWINLTSKPSTFPATAHASSHVPGGADNIFPTNASGWLHNDGSGNHAYTTPTPAQVGALAVAATAADSAKLNGQNPSYYLNTTQLGVASGVATLDAGGKIPTSQLPASVLGGLNYQGTWNAAANVPTLVSGVGTKGHYYKVSVAGTTTIDGYSNWGVGDWIVFDGTVWQDVDNTESVTTVAGRTGAISLAVTDISGAAPLASPALSGTPTAPTAATGDSSTTVATTAFVKNQSYITSAGAPVQSVNGSTGAVTLTTSNVAEGSNLYYTQARFNTAFSGKSTTDLTEGTNLYYTQARFDSAFAAKAQYAGNAATATKLATARTINGVSFDGSANIDISAISNPIITGPILPAGVGQDIGSATQRFRGIYVDTAYLSTNTLYLGTTAVMGTDATTVNIKADPGQNITVATTGTGQSKMTSANGVELSTSGMNADVKVQATGAGSRAVLGATLSVDITSPSTNVNGNLAVTGNTAFSGDVTFNGSTTIVNATTVEAKDNIIGLNAGEVGAGVTAGSAGIRIHRGSLADQQLIFDESNDKWKIGSIGTEVAIATENFVGAITTANVAESGNLYYTQARFDAAFSGKTTANLTESGNLYYTQSRFDSAFTAKSTSNLSEGTNLYYTQTRFDTAFAAKSTTNLTEGTNLYFSNNRVLTAPLTGFSAAAGGTVSSADNVLIALQKLEYRTAANDLKVTYPGLPSFAQITSKPTTLSGYGISDAALSTHNHTLDGLSNVAMTTKATGDILKWNGASWVNNTLAQAGIQAAGSYVLASSVGAASGVASLDSGGKVPVSQLPASVTGGMNYQGTWNASTNSPAITAGVGTKGYYYKVATAGSTSIDGNSSWTVGDMIAFNGSTWDLIQGGTSDVSSVFGRVGAVTLQSGDVTTALGFTPYNSTNPAGYITSAGSVSWTNVSGRPTNVSSFTNDSGYITSASLPSNPMYYAGFTLDANTMGYGAMGFTYAINAPWTGPIMHTSANNYGMQINANYNTGTHISFRVKNGDGNNWNAWYELISSANIGSQSVNYAASAGSANSVAWGNVSGRPTAVSSFSNDSGYITSGGSCSYATSAGSVNMSSGRTDSTAYPIVWGTTGGTSQMYCCNAVTITSSTGQISATKAVFNGAGVMPLSLQTSSAGPWGLEMYRTDLGLGSKIYNDNGQRWYFEHIPCFAGNNPIHTGNIASQKVDGALKLWATSHPADYYIVNNWTGTYWQLTTNHGAGVQVAYANSAGSAPASDVYSWAKQSSKPSYSAAEVGAMADGGSYSTIHMASWFRSSGATGWYNETYATGIYSTGASWVQTYNGSSFQANGTLTATGDVIAYYSDSRLKENIRPIENALEKLMQIRGVFFNSNDLAELCGYSDRKEQVGVIAQEVQAVLPHVVVPAPFDVDRDTGASKSGNDYLTVKYERLVPLLIEAVKEQQSQIEELKALVAALVEGK